VTERITAVTLIAAADSHGDVLPDRSRDVLPACSQTVAKILNHPLIQPYDEGTLTRPISQYPAPRSGSAEPRDLRHRRASQFLDNTDPVPDRKQDNLYPAVANDCLVKGANGRYAIATD
jgi:hypothetical protein